MPSASSMSPRASAPSTLKDLNLYAWPGTEDDSSSDASSEASGCDDASLALPLDLPLAEGEDGAGKCEVSPLGGVAASPAFTRAASLNANLGWRLGRPPLAVRTARGDLLESLASSTGAGTSGAREGSSVENLQDLHLYKWPIDGDDDDIHDACLPSFFGGSLALHLSLLTSTASTFPMAAANCHATRTLASAPSSQSLAPSPQAFQEAPLEIRQTVASCDGGQESARKATKASTRGSSALTSKSHKQQRSSSRRIRNSAGSGRGRAGRNFSTATTCSSGTAGYSSSCTSSRADGTGDCSASSVDIGCSSGSSGWRGGRGFSAPGGTLSSLFPISFQMGLPSIIRGDGCPRPPAPAPELPVDTQWLSAAPTSQALTQLPQHAASPVSSSATASPRSGGAGAYQDSPRGRDPFSPQPVAPPQALMGEMPDDILLSIFARLDPQARPALGLVCHRWRRIEVRLRERLKLDYGTYFPLRPWQGGPHGGAYRGFLDFTLERILPQMTSLRHIDVTHAVKLHETAITDDGLVLMGTWCKKLETLRLNVASQGLTGRGVTAALLGCGRSLRELELQRCSGVGREALKAIAEYCPRLEALSLKACPLVSDQGLLHFRNARCRHTLKRLNLSQCRNVRDRGLVDIAQSFPGLTSLDVSHCDVTDVGVLALPACCPELHVFCARGCSDLSNVSMKALAAGSAELVELDVRRARWITAAGVSAVLRHCLRLRRMCVDDSMTSDDVRELARAQRVELIAASSQHRTPQLLPWV